MLDRIRERFLDDAVGSEVEPGWQCPLVAFHGELDLQADRTVLLEQRTDVLEGGAGLEPGLRCHVLAQDTEQAPHLAERLPPGFLDAEERLFCPVGSSSRSIRAAPA